MILALPFPPVSPEIFAFDLGSWHLALRWYPMGYIVGILIGWRIAVAALRRPALWPGTTAPMAPALAETLVTSIVLGVILGGRLGYVLFYRPAFYLANPLEIPQVWDGGMSFHGGFIGVVVAVLLFCRRHKVPLSATADIAALTAAPAIFLVRCANFINGELWGRPSDLPWAVIFPGPAAQDCGLVLTQTCARHPSQLYEALLEGLVLGAIVMFAGFRRGALRHPWRVTGLFLICYGIARFAVEFVRQPDAQFVSPGNPLGLFLHWGGYGLTMGQTLSLPMLAIGLWVILRTRA